MGRRRAALPECPAEALQFATGAVRVNTRRGSQFSQIGRVPAPKRSELAAGASKEKLVGRLRETFQFCESALARVNDSKLRTQVPYGGGEISRALRLNGLLPPTAKGGQS